MAESQPANEIAVSNGSALPDPEMYAAKLDTEIRALAVQNSPNVRVVRREYSKALCGADPEYVLAMAREIISVYGYRGLAYELILYNKAAFRTITRSELEELGQGIDSWHAVDGFGRLLSGPVWRDSQITDNVIHSWARSPDRWWRRAALVSTVALNVRSHGGRGDTARTIAVCEILIDDHDDMVVKAMSWALRELVVHDPTSVQEFLALHNDRLAARVKREVNNKLKTGLKNPRSAQT